jgi:hypothetical protein
MSLIRVRRNRKREWLDVKKGASANRLVILLVLVVAIIWYLSYRF